MSNPCENDDLAGNPDMTLLSYSRRGLAALLLLTIFINVVGSTFNPASAADNAAPSALRQYNIPPGPLTEVLNLFAEQAGIFFSGDAKLTQGHNSPGLQGQYSEQDAMAKLLQGSGLHAEQDASGSYILQSLPTGVTTLPTVKVEADRETAVSPIIGYVAKRSATGTKTDTPIIETPQSISVVTADRIAAIGTTTLRDALAYTPGVNVSPYGPDSRFESTWFFLRGFDTYNPGPYMDGLTLRNNYTWAVWQTDNYAAERVEILRGPASVLYGQGSPGGVVNIVSKRPTLEPLHEVQLQVGSYNRYQLAGDFSGAVNQNDQLLYRVTAVARDAEYPIEGEADDRLFIAPSLTWNPSADTSVTFLSHYLRGRAGVYSRVVMEQGSLVPLPDGSHSPRTFVGDPGFDRQDQDQWAVGYSAEHHVNEKWKLQQNLRYGQIRTRLDEVFSGTNYITVNPNDPDDPANFRSINRAVFGSNEKARVFSVDNQLEGNFSHGLFEDTLLLGLDYQNSSFDAVTYFGDAQAPLNLYAPEYNQQINSNVTPYFDGNTKIEQTGLYTQLQSKFAQRLVVILGGRYDWAKSHVRDAATATDLRQSDGKFTGRAGLVYLLPAGFAPYVSYSESFTPTATINPDNGEPFKPETARQNEIGLRYQPEGRSDSYSIAAFDLRRQNYITVDKISNKPKQTGEVTVKGVELEALFKPLRDLNVTASYSWTPKAEVTASSNPDELGVNINGVSKNMGSLWADYLVGGGVKIGLGTRYVGPNHGIGDTAITEVPSYALIDAMLGYASGNWDFKLNARNLTDRVYITSCGGGSCYLGDQRRVNVTAGYRW